MGKHRNYTKFSKSEYESVNDNVVDIFVEAVEEVDPQGLKGDVGEPGPKVTTGIVTDCVKLNVRESPRKTAPVVCTIDCLTEVMIDRDHDDEFYHIYTETGIEGFCMKKFITVR